jgi:hypothetical protein
MSDNLYLQCLAKAEWLVNNNYPVGDMGVEILVDLLYKLEIEKLDKQKISDAAIDYNDRIMAIEPMGELETVDISVSGDNLFYCNGVLTKNSFGLPATADLMFALISSEELEKLNQVMVKQLKNRYSDVGTYKRFSVGIDRSRMKMYDVDDPMANIIDVDDTSTTDNTPMGKRTNDEMKNKLKDFK